ncbi:tetratricopeptide repeat protein, partial [Candidatus Viridilinea mediisalina]
SLDYSLRRLSHEQRALLPLLAPFEGGALEIQLLEISELPAATWQPLRDALERAALLSVEHIPNINPPYLRFHPILAPALRARHGEPQQLLERYATRYAELAEWLYHEDDRNPMAVRALVQRELPNLRRALGLLERQQAQEQVVVMANQIARFLNDFGMGRELVRLREVQAAAAAHLQAAAGLSRAAYLQAYGAGEDAFNRGDLPRAYQLFSQLHERIRQQPAGAARGPGSYEESLTLAWLARCLRLGGQPAAAEQRLRAALALVEALIAQAPEDKLNIRQRGGLLTELGDALGDQGRYAAAREAYEQSLDLKRTLGGDPRGEGVVLGQLGTLALRQRDYDAATRRYQEALALFRRLDEPSAEATAYHQLGRVAEEQRNWAAAEGYYRESLTIAERHNDQAGAATTCNELAIVAEGAGRPAEAEGWYRRALALDEQVQPDSALHASHLSNLADLLATEIRAGRMAATRLSEAQGYAARALAIREQLDASSEIWKILSILATLADLAGDTAAAAAYRRRERETFAQFAGNRYHIDQQFGPLIQAIVAAAQGDGAARVGVEERLPQLEAKGWLIAEAVRRIWAGERAWHGLCEGLDSQDALLVLRVLEEVGGEG